MSTKPSNAARREEKSERINLKQAKVKIALGCNQNGRKDESDRQDGKTAGVVVGFRTVIGIFRSKKRFFEILQFKII